MSDWFAALPMYDWPERHAEVDAEWAAIRDRLRAVGVDAPKNLVRRNVDLPPVPGGILDEQGKVIAPDPATLPPDELDFHVVWTHPRLLFAQTCWGPMELGLAKHVRLVGQPDYSDIEGGWGEFYSSAIIMRAPLPSPLWGGSDHRCGVGVEAASTPITSSEASRPPPRSAPRIDPPHRGEGKSCLPPLDLIRGKRFAYNSDDSMSGVIALTRDLEAMGENLDLFSERIESGGHRNSIIAVAEGRADAAAIDCMSWALARRFEPAARQVEVVGWTGMRKGLPYIASRHLQPKLFQSIRDVVAGNLMLG